MEERRGYGRRRNKTGGERGKEEAVRGREGRERGRNGGGGGGKERERRDGKMEREESIGKEEGVGGEARGMEGALGGGKEMARGLKAQVTKRQEEGAYGDSVRCCLPYCCCCSAFVTFSTDPDAEGYCFS